MAKTHLAVLGSPIEHSKSPLIHAAAYRHLGLDWDYGRYRVEADELESFLKLRDASWRGLSLTMPLKEQGHRLSIPSCPVASETGIVNTLVHTESGWEGYNTDSFGIQQALKNALTEVPSEISILGSGATAISAFHAVSYIYPDANVRVFARRSTSVLGYATEPLDGFYGNTVEGLVISTLPGTVVHPSLDVVEGSSIFDVAYNPWPSKLAAQWPAENRISGLEMLLWQALVQIRLFLYGDGTVKLPEEPEVFSAMREAVKL
jgi:shikimate dehydrogenase